MPEKPKTFSFHYGVEVMSPQCVARIIPDPDYKPHYGSGIGSNATMSFAIGIALGAAT